MDRLQRAGRRAWCLAIAACVATTALHAAPPLAQLPGTAACISETGSGGACADGVALDGASAVVVSPDGRQVYVASVTSDAVVAFDRDVATGALTQQVGLAACVSEDGTAGACANGVALDGSSGLGMSPDGRNLYVAALQSKAVAVFDRDLAHGTLTQKAGTDGCVSATGSGGACVVGVALGAVSAAAVSPDGRNLYLVSGTTDSLAVFDRDPSTGVLTQKAGTQGCVSEDGSGGSCVDGIGLSGLVAVAVSPDGGSVYAAGQLGNSIAVFDRDLSTGVLTQKAGMAGCWSETGSGGLCMDAVALVRPVGIAVSADGRNLYVASVMSSAVAVFDRTASGFLTQKAPTSGCVSEDGTAGSCADGEALGVASVVAVSTDGRNVYVGTASPTNSVAVFDRVAATGVISQKAGVAGCVSETGTGGLCTDGVALGRVAGIAVAPDGGSVYSTSFDGDAVAAFDRSVPSYDIDGDGQTEPLTDGLLLLRYMFGFNGATLVNGAVDLANCTRCTAPAIEAYIKALSG